MHWGKSFNNKLLFRKWEILLLIFIVSSAFIYEIIALALLDRIGLDERISGKNGRVVRTYGLMGVNAAIFLWILGMTNNSHASLFILLFLCFLSILFISKNSCDIKDIKIMSD